MNLPTIANLIEGHRRFREGLFRQNRDHFARLAQSQSPNLAVIACCDARVDPAVIMDCAPGDLFLIRNVANLVPPFEQGGWYHGTSAALEFAVCELGVEHVLLLGHARCGGIRALIDRNLAATRPGSFIGGWMRIAAQARQEVFARSDLATTDERTQACELAALRISLANLRSFPWIRERLAGGSLALHAWYYDLASGELMRLDEANGRTVPLVSAEPASAPQLD